ncbi:hypothetical protein CLM62_03885 [Streptomyces sp. SA15]|uniref:hypothetical protein n=1 Tax=Streptomyces sp. SA15 TaxID=934019 RepID=UPI000BAFA84B|nr:hypothetical protein [Streptomyces sp. SA15]PAZ17136.1 hypothetical protein CLM62_03885 [Streptomyces sp. SA15]
MDSDKQMEAALTSLWAYYDEHAAQARQHENLRATVTSTLAGIAAAVVTLAGVGGLSKADILTGVVVIILSVLGFALSFKHYERNRMHTEILGQIRGRIDQLHDQSVTGWVRTEALRDAGKKENKKKFPRLKRIRLHILWLGLPMAIGLVGIAVIVFSAVGVAPR